MKNLYPTNQENQNQMSSFPLYDTLYKKIELKKQPLNEHEIAFFIDKFSCLGEYEHEYIFALIRKYQSQFHDQLNELPWGIKSIKKGIKIDIEKLPEKLQQLLYIFLNTHIESMK